MENHQLSEVQLQELMSRYYDGENIRSLIEEFNLNVHINSLVKIFPNIILENLICPYCDIPLVIPAFSRSSGFIDHSRAYCETCGHRNYKSCKCIGCENIRNNKQAEKRDELERNLNNILRPKGKEILKLDSLSLSSAVNLVGLCRAGLMENSDQIKAAANLSDIVAYDFETKESIYFELSQDGLIDICIQSSLESVELLVDDDKRIRHEYLVWELTLGGTGDDNLAKLTLIEHILKNRNMWPTHWYAELLPMWIELALEEILLYLSLKLRAHQLEPQVGEKTKKVFTDLLEDFSIFQIYNFIWVSVTNAVAYQVRTGIGRRHTANLIPGSCQKRAEKAKCEDWVIKEYRRDVSVPMSTRVSLFSNVITDLGDGFFTSIPCKELIISN